MLYWKYGRDYNFWLFLSLKLCLHSICGAKSALLFSCAEQSMKLSTWNGDIVSGTRYSNFQKQLFPANYIIGVYMTYVTTSDN